MGGIDKVLEEGYTQSPTCKITIKTKDVGLAEQGYEKRALEPPNDMAG